MTGARALLFSEYEKQDAHDIMRPKLSVVAPAAPDISEPAPRWQDAAACLGMDREMFFSGDIHTPKKVCNRCEVQEICLWYTMMMEQSSQRYGMFGGMTTTARQRLGQGISQEQAATFYDEDVRVWRRGRAEAHAA